jgi:hypothetical protein
VRDLLNSEKTVGWAKPTGRANARPMINSACPPRFVDLLDDCWWARREERYGFRLIAPNEHAKVMRLILR